MSFAACNIHESAVRKARDNREVVVKVGGDSEDDGRMW